MAQKRKSLAVFVHGIGADERKWWGTTPHSFRSDADLNHILFDFWTYETSKLPRTMVIWNRFRGRQLADLEQLGELFWTHLSTTHVENGPFSSIALFGHSMGGLVVASAIVYGWRLAENRGLRSAISVVGMCATPLGGSDLAKVVRLFTSLYGSNTHVKDICQNSSLRKKIVAEFQNRVYLGESTGEKVLLEFFKVPQDTTVSTDEERYGPFIDQVTKHLSLVGGHSECVKDLSREKHNYSVIPYTVRD